MSVKPPKEYTLGYHAFLCYNSNNIREVKILLEYLNNSHIKVFFDVVDLLAGSSRNLVIDEAIKDSDSIVVLIGPDGIGPWQEENFYSVHWESVNNHKFVIPVLLPGAGIDDERIPSFLRSRSYVKFKHIVEEEDVIQKIIENILRGRLIPPAGNILEKHVTALEFKRLHESTIKAYCDTKKAEKFYEVWRDNIPFSKLELLEKRLNSESKILDAGCGPGHHSKYLSSKGFNVTGIDLSEASLAIAEKICLTNKQNVKFKKMDMRGTSFPRNEFDAVWACASCVHTPQALLNLQLREFVRILKPGGLVGVTLQVERVPAVESDGRFFEGYTSVGKIFNCFKASGLEPIDLSEDISGMTTDNVKKVVKWVACIGKVSEK